MSPGLTVETFKNLFVKHVPEETAVATKDAHFMADDQSVFAFGNVKLLRNICEVAPVVVTAGAAH